MVSPQLLRDIPGFADWVTVHPLNRGWSKDQKFYIEDASGSRLLLRVARPEQYHRKKLEYGRITRFAGLDIVMPRPVDFGRCDGGSRVYTLLTWVDGREAEAVLPELADEQQYQLGVCAGGILRQMHSLPAPDGENAWSERYGRKIESVIDRYLKCEVRVPCEESIIEFLCSSTTHLEGRPQSLQHGDYHTGNMLVTPGMRLGVIDFDRCSAGDPWEEYDRFVFSWRCSVPFALGQLHGYFDGCVPADFFRLMCLYNATNLLASIPWAADFGADELQAMLCNARRVAECYNGFSTCVPTWYREPAGTM
ncbi:MAG: phosphotransferase [Bacillota bacterium]